MAEPNAFGRLLGAGEVIVADGGMGTMLMERGLAAGGCPELLNVEHPDVVAAIHAEYIAAGADVILTNTFGGNRIRLGHSRLGDRIAELNTAAAEIAREAAATADRTVAVAGSLGPTGELLTPYGTLEPEAAADVFREQVEVLGSAGVDVLWIETMSSVEELDAAFAAASAADLPIVATMSFDTNGRTMMGVPPEALAQWAAALSSPPVGVGANCGVGPDEAIATVQAVVAQLPGVTPVAKANCGRPELDAGGSAKYPLGPDAMAEYAEAAVQSGARIVGACCGSTPAHIAAIRRAVATTAQT